jgi:hypothetical protein
MTGELGAEAIQRETGNLGCNMGGGRKLLLNVWQTQYLHELTDAIATF